VVSRLPKWVEFGAFVLSLIAGTVNAVGLLGFEHQSVSHLSGTATLLGSSFINLPLQTSFHLFGILFSFLLGSCVAGFLLHGETLRLGKHYDTTLFLEAALLFAAIMFLSQGSFYGHFFASGACGLQNALATRYSGAVIRTTHVTGIFTDLGLMIGSFFRGEPLDKRKAQLFVIIIFGFIFGGVFGAWLYQYFLFWTLIFPASTCLLLALSYRIYLKKQIQASHLSKGS